MACWFALHLPQARLALRAEAKWLLDFQQVVGDFSAFAQLLQTKVEALDQLRIAGNLPRQQQVHAVSA